MSSAAAEKDTMPPPAKVPKIRKRKRKESNRARQKASASVSTSSASSSSSSSKGDDGGDGLGIGDGSTDGAGGEGGSDSDSDPDRTVTETLADLRAERQFRSRKTGLDSRQLMKSRGVKVSATQEHVVTYGLQNKEEYGANMDAINEKEGIISGSAFAAETSQKQEDKHMMDYVDERLGLKQQGGGGRCGRS